MEKTLANGNLSVICLEMEEEEGRMQVHELITNEAKITFRKL